MRKSELSSKGLYCRNGIYYFRKVIPAHLRKAGAPTEIILSLKTRDEDIARARYADAKSSAEEELIRMRDKNYIPFDKNDDFTQSQRRANTQGRELKDIREIINNPIVVRETVLALKRKKRITKSVMQSFVCKNNNEPRLNDLPSLYVKALDYQLKKLNKREYSRKINPLKNACKNLVKFLNENKKISDISRKDAKSFFDYLKERINRNEISGNTANKYLSHLRVLIKQYYKENDMYIDCVFSSLRFKDDGNKRNALEIKYIREKWINSDALLSMNTDLKYIIYAMIDTGCNFKELCGLDPEQDIRLKDTIPHIILRENKYRKLKTRFRERRIPLVGLALEAFMNSPEGFERYRNANGPNNASAAINKFLNENSLFQITGQTAYCIRHCFKDRMREHSIPAEMQDYLMGHKSPGMGSHYGQGYTLEKIYEYLKRMAGDI